MVHEGSHVPHLITRERMLNEVVNASEAHFALEFLALGDDRESEAQLLDLHHKVIFPYPKNVHDTTAGIFCAGEQGAVRRCGMLQQRHGKLNDRRSNILQTTSISQTAWRLRGGEVSAVKKESQNTSIVELLHLLPPTSCGGVQLCKHSTIEATNIGVSNNNTHRLG